MPTSGSPRRALLVDTSVAVALSVADHAGHAATAKALGRQRLGLAGHATFETYSVLTRLPQPARRTPAAVARLLATNFPHSRFLSPKTAGALLAELASSGIAGGSVYDALAGAAAAEHGAALATRDRRAMDTYRALNVEVELLAP